MTNIVSKDNEKYKLWSKLLQRKYREKEGLFLIEGELLIRDAMSEGYTLKDIIISSKVDSPKDYVETNIYGGANKKKEVSGETTKEYVLAEELFRKLSQTETGRDVIAVVRRPKFDLDSLKKDRGCGRCILVSDGIADPGNMGTIIRTCDAAGYSGIVLMKGSCDPFSPKVVRSAAGSILRLPILELDSAEDLKNLVDELGLRIAIATEKGSDIFWNQDISDGIALVMGNEGSGVSPKIAKMADLKLRIPMEGSIDSLNVGVAASIIIFESIRQHKLCK